MLVLSLNVSFPFMLPHDWAALIFGMRGSFSHRDGRWIPIVCKKVVGLIARRALSDHGMFQRTCRNLGSKRHHPIPCSGARFSSFPMARAKREKLK
ncbi:hypothetical protein F4808DRAFT_97832 [Astrocystis sublimbata]|nr:hypothetical protein F4808DRAFT_97832 [Astrocystis sublimbata]